MSKFSLEDLAALIAERAKASAETSYTKSLLDAGPAHAGKKMGEEAIEAAIAAALGERQALVHESADLLYHLLVVLQSRGIALGEVLTELEKRTAQSGHEEKDSRKS
ncbi:MAG TPA: phosphoribosyl-ATP diphosphatase [Methylovirgula sp.]|nr:phosphoribosyl-ATP diphosphatase [Methylovirgula sp.]